MKEGLKQKVNPGGGVSLEYIFLSIYDLVKNRKSGVEIQCILF